MSTRFLTRAARLSSATTLEHGSPACLPVRRSVPHACLSTLLPTLLSTLLPALMLAGASGGAMAEPLAALQSMAFLAGHCWKGDFPGGKQSDEHCFAWLYDGKALRDTHTVRTPGKPDYVGETTYYYDSAAKKVEFLYVENLGGISRGTVESTPGALVFPPTQYVADGATIDYRVRWTMQGGDAYEAFSEMQYKGQWVTQFKLVLKRQ